jgi:hypothetical protein
VAVFHYLEQDGLTGRALALQCIASWAAPRAYAILMTNNIRNDSPSLPRPHEAPSSPHDVTDPLGRTMERI